MSAGKVILGIGLAAGAIGTAYSAQYDNPPGYSHIGYAWQGTEDAYGNGRWPLTFDLKPSQGTAQEPATTLAPRAVVERAVQKLHATKEPACPEKLPDYQYKINGKEPTRAICLNLASFAVNADGSVNVSPAPVLNKKSPISIDVPETLNMTENAPECPKVQRIMTEYAGFLLHGAGLVPKGQEVKIVFVTDPKRPGLSQCDSKYVPPVKPATSNKGSAAINP